MLENSDSRAQDGATLSPGSMLFDELQLVGSRLSSAATQNTLHQFPELAARYRKVMCGDLEQRLTTKAKIIRVFTSSTFTGKHFVNERAHVGGTRDGVVDDTRT